LGGGGGELLAAQHIIGSIRKGKLAAVQHVDELRYKSGHEAVTELREVLSRTGQCVPNGGHCLLEVAAEAADKGALVAHIVDVLPLHLGHRLKRSFAASL